MTTPDMIENRTFDEISVGDSASLSRTLGEQEIQLFALASGDVNPAHLDPEFAATDMFHRVIAHGLWGGGLISAVLGTELPGPGTIYLGQTLRFVRPVGLGDTITASGQLFDRSTGEDAVHLFCIEFSEIRQRIGVHVPCGWRENLDAFSFDVFPDQLNGLAPLILVGTLLAIPADVPGNLDKSEFLHRRPCRHGRPVGFVDDLAELDAKTGFAGIFQD